MGLSESEVIERALDVFFVAQQAVATTELREEMRDWQKLGFESLERFEKRLKAKSNRAYAKR